MAALQLLGMAHSKQLLHVRVPLLLREVRLRGVVAHTHHRRGVDGQPRQLRDALRQAFALVVAALAESLQRKGDGQQHVGAAEKVGALQVGGQHASPGYGHLRLIVILDGEQHATVGRGGFIVHQSMGAAHGRRLVHPRLHLGKVALKHVVPCALPSRAGQVAEAHATQPLLAG